MVSVQTFVTLFQTILPEPEAGLLSGIVFGAKAALNVDLKTALTTTGTIHIIALSGMNITIVENLVATTLYRYIGRRMACLLTIVLIMGFVCFVGVSASVVRAAIMGSLGLLSTLFGRQKSSVFALVLASYGMILYSPSYLSDVGFLLSVGATLGIILFSKSLCSKRLWESRLPILIRMGYGLIRDDLGTTLSAQIFTVPILMCTFHQISFIAPLVNVLISWTIAPVTILGMLTALLGVLNPVFAVIPAWFCYILLHFVVLIVTTCASFPFASLAW
jgi:competence protein ComEC